MTDFQALAIPPAILNRLTAAQFLTPTAVQAAAIPPGIEGRDLLATAQTGTGKTVAFLVPILAHLAVPAKTRGLRALILTPTRELAMQIAAQFDQLRLPGMRPAALMVGGLSERPQLNALHQGATLAVATPGRLEDFLQRRLVRLDGVTTLVLDEADRMLDIGFLPSIRRILAALPAARQTLCFSATLAPELARLAQECQRDPVRVELGSTLKPAASVTLRAIPVDDGGKLPLLQALLRAETGRCLVFARTKRGTERLTKDLVRAGFAATMIHGNRSQSQRTSALHGFQRGTFQILVATDVAARGIHVDDVAHVINYDLPEAPDDFVHRVGRTGRAGGSGIASTLVRPEEVDELRQMERRLGIKLEGSAALVPSRPAAPPRSARGAGAGFRSARPGGRPPMRSGHRPRPHADAAPGHGRVPGPRPGRPARSGW